MNVYTKPAACLAAVLFGATALLAQSTRTLINDNFSDGTKNGADRATQWFTVTGTNYVNPVVAASDSNSLNAGAKLDFSGMAANAVSFYSSYSNNALLANFPSVTLAAAGDYLKFSAQFIYAAVQSAGNASTGPTLGLYNSNGTRIAADVLDNAAPAAIADDTGYRILKRLDNGTSADVLGYEHTNVGGFATWSGTNTSLGSEATSTPLAGLTVYTITLKIVLADNLSDLNLIYSIEGGSGTEAIDYEKSFTAIAAKTTTFDEAVIMPFAGWNAKAAVVSNILLETNVAIPEPTAFAVFLASLSALPFLAFRLCRSRMGRQ
ncbi:MAG: hypothetical protein LBK99_18985 [Opitutaceae bacterium]|jgi:hypothetical protein|nr:hypothetical protein [Opitutaceae bacterium]